MTRPMPRSLQFHLALRLGLVFLFATVLAVVALIFETYRTAESLGEQNLMTRAEALAGFVKTGPSGEPVLDMPATMATDYETSGEALRFAVRAGNHGVIAASEPAMRTFVSGWAPADDAPRFFRPESLESDEAEYYGLDWRVDSAAGPVSVTIVEAGEPDALLHAMLEEFVSDAAWVFPIFIGVTLLVGVLTIRQGLRPLRRVSTEAAQVTPGAMSYRLSTQGIPAEAMPLVTAVNEALDRLEEGFATQRRFTANAAHELRTPLAIITGALDSIEGEEELTKLRHDVARMNRLVDQLLRVARLDALTLDVGETVDLRACANDVVERMAPVAIGQGRTIALAGADRPVPVKGNRYAIEDALRNLIENALAHTPPQTEVLVEVATDGSVSVSDQGPGVPPEDREHLFDRFWRAQGKTGEGAGLGLAIVQETMNAHGGHVEVGESPEGGARFTLRFRLDGAPSK